MSENELIAELVDATRLAKRGEYASDERLLKTAFALQDIIERLRRELAEVTAERDRLREIVQKEREWNAETQRRIDKARAALGGG